MGSRRLVVGMAATALLISGVVAPAGVAAGSRGVTMTTREVHGGQAARAKPLGRIDRERDAALRTGRYERRVHAG